MPSNPSEEKWQVRTIRSGLPGLNRLPELGLPDLTRLPWLNQPMLPAEIDGGLRDAMLAHENHLEDVNYQKIVPNRYVVEVNPENYARHYRPIEGQIIKQWNDRLLEELITANSRRGRREFRLGGRLRLEVRPGSGLKANEARILSRIDPDASQAVPRAPAPAPLRNDRRPSRPSPEQIKPSDIRPTGAKPGGMAASGTIQPQGGPVSPPVEPGPAQPGRGSEHPHPTNAPAGSVAYIEMIPSGQTWAIYPGINTIGRSESCQIYLDNPVIQERRLVSGVHAYILFENSQCILFDGSPSGRPSANGTYVNLRRVMPQGYRLQNGDAIVLAALDPLFPRSDTPGVATFYFWTNRRE